jgi:hypothetical protein
VVPVTGGGLGGSQARAGLPKLGAGRQGWQARRQAAAAELAQQAWAQVQVSFASWRTAVHD